VDIYNRCHSRVNCDHRDSAMGGIWPNMQISSIHGYLSKYGQGQRSDGGGPKLPFRLRVRPAPPPSTI
jgi:hypothetical protein